MTYPLTCFRKLSRWEFTTNTGWTDSRKYPKDISLIMNVYDFKTADQRAALYLVWAKYLLYLRLERLGYVYCARIGFKQKLSYVALLRMR